jgi:hypothetical protein
MTGYVSDIWLGVDGLLAPVTIYKTPLEVINSAPTNLLYGYSDTSQTTNEQIFLTPVYQTFSGQIIYPKRPRGGNNNAYFDNKLSLDPNSTYLRSKGEEIYNYINDGQKVEKIEADGKSWNYTNVTQQQNFLNLRFYYFEIKATN